MIPVRPFQRENALRYSVYYAARLLPHPTVRNRVAAAVRFCINTRQGKPEKAGGAPAQAAMAALRDGGLAPVSGPLDTAQLDAIMGYLATAPVAKGASTEPVTAQSLGVRSAAYDLPTILACPSLLGVMNDPEVLAVAAGFLGCKPTISGVGLRWSFACDDAQSTTQQFHRDMEDWKILRLFVYLTDVYDDCGPHQFVSASHKTRGRLRLRPYSDQDVADRFGSEKVVTIVGPRGTAFMADMWGVHRGVPPSGRPRLLFSCTYTMTPTSIYHYSPVAVAGGHAYDRYTNRLIIR